MAGMLDRFLFWLAVQVAYTAFQEGYVKGYNAATQDAAWLLESYTQRP